MKSVIIALDDIPALTFAGLRYSLAFACLLPFAWRSGELGALKTLDRRMWIKLLALGVLFYAVTQGAQFLGLQYLPAVTVSLILNFTPVFVVLLGSLLRTERAYSRQWFGIGLAVVNTAFAFTLWNNTLLTLSAV